MKALLLTIPTPIEVGFYELNRIREVTPEREADLQQNLMQGNYMLNFETMQVDSLPNLEPQAAFKLVVDETTETILQLV